MFFIWKKKVPINHFPNRRRFVFEGNTCHVSGVSPHLVLSAGPLGGQLLVYGVT